MDSLAWSHNNYRIGILCHIWVLGTHAPQGNRIVQWYSIALNSLETLAGFYADAMKLEETINAQLHDGYDHLRGDVLIMQ